MAQFLFIGGKCDGQYREVHSLDSIYTVHLGTEPIDDRSFRMVREYYRMERFNSPSLSLIFFRWEHITLDEAITKLFAGYSPITPTRFKDSIDYRLNEYLCGMKEGWDDSIVGFNQAWDIMRAVFRELMPR